MTKLTHIEVKIRLQDLSDRDIHTVMYNLEGLACSIHKNYPEDFTLVDILTYNEEVNGGYSPDVKSVEDARKAITNFHASAADQMEKAAESINWEKEYKEVYHSPFPSNTPIYKKEED